MEKHRNSIDFIDPRNVAARSVLRDPGIRGFAENSGIDIPTSL